MDIHNYTRQHEAYLRGLKDAKITQKNKALIRRFHDDLVLENLSTPRLIMYLNKTKLLAMKLEKNFEDADIQDLKKLVGVIQQSDYSIYTKQTYKVILRRLYNWLKKPDHISWINIGVSRSEKTLPADGDLLTEEEVQRLIAATDHPRDKAFISTLWESGARISEIGNMQIKNVCFDSVGTVLTVKGKTGSRKIRLIASTPYLSTWIQNHPNKIDPEESLWVNVGSKKHNHRIKYGGLARVLKITFKKAGVKKRCNPHIFRHSRATYMANHLTEFQMNQYFGWIQGSDMPSTYVHMSGKNVDDAILVMNGLEVQDKGSKQAVRPPICPRCDTLNAINSNHCHKCGGILDLKVAIELQERKEQELKARSMSDDLMNVLMKDKDIQSLIMEKMRLLKAEGYLS